MIPYLFGGVPKILAVNPLPSRIDREFTFLPGYSISCFFSGIRSNPSTY
jgi:hypothetical protein